MMDSEQLLTGEVARACGVSADTIRHYERRGVIAAAQRDAGGYRRYPAAVVGRVLMVRRALRLGFSLDELCRILRKRAAGMPPCHEVRALAECKLRDVDARIADLTELRRTLTSTLEEWDRRLAMTAEGEPAHLLESLR